MDVVIETYFNSNHRPMCLCDVSQQYMHTYIHAHTHNVVPERIMLKLSMPNYIIQRVGNGHASQLVAWRN
jgi:hypothetical protein